MSGSDPGAYTSASLPPIAPTPASSGQPASAVGTMPSVAQPYLLPGGGHFMPPPGMLYAPPPMMQPAMPADAPAAPYKLIRRVRFLAGAMAALGIVSVVTVMPDLVTIGSIIVSILAFKAARSAHIPRLRFFSACNACLAVFSIVGIILMSVMVAPSSRCACSSSCVADTYERFHSVYNASSTSPMFAGPGVRALREPAPPVHGAALPAHPESERAHVAASGHGFLHRKLMHLRRTAGAWIARRAAALVDAHDGEEAAADGGAHVPEERGHHARPAETDAARRERRERHRQRVREWIRTHGGANATFHHGHHHARNGTHTHHGHRHGHHEGGALRLRQHAKRLQRAERAEQQIESRPIVPLPAGAPAQPVRAMPPIVAQEIPRVLQHAADDRDAVAKEPMTPDRKRTAPPPPPAPAPAPVAPTAADTPELREREDARASGHGHGGDRERAPVTAADYFDDEDEDDEDEEEDEEEVMEHVSVRNWMLWQQLMEEPDMPKAQFVMQSKRVCKVTRGVMGVGFTLLSISFVFHLVAARAASKLARHAWTKYHDAIRRAAAAAGHRYVPYLPPAGGDTQGPAPGGAHPTGGVPQAAVAMPTAGVVPVAPQPEGDVLDALAARLSHAMRAGRTFVSTAMQRRAASRYTSVPSAVDGDVEMEAYQQQQQQQQQQAMHQQRMSQGAAMASPHAQQGMPVHYPMPTAAYNPAMYGMPAGQGVMYPTYATPVGPAAMVHGGTNFVRADGPSAPAHGSVQSYA